MERIPSQNSSPLTTVSPCSEAPTSSPASPAHFEGHDFVSEAREPQHNKFFIPTEIASDPSTNLESKEILWPRVRDITSEQEQVLATQAHEISARIAADTPQKFEDSLEVFLQQKGFPLHTNNPDKIIGEGSFGTVYLITVEGHDFVFKKEVSLEQLNHADLNGKLWRCGDIAASRLKDLPHFAKAEFFILRLRDPSKSASETWYVPTSKIKEFGLKLKRSHPEVIATILGSLMARAPGDELLTCLSNNSINPLVDFEPISRQLFEFLEITHARNFIHRDIKLENMIYDTSTKTLTVIDAAIGGVYSKRGKERSSSNNPKKSTLFKGTESYMDPRVKRRDPYDSTIDFYSAGIALLLTLITDLTDYDNIMGVLQSSKVQQLAPTEILDRLLDMLKIYDSSIIRTLEQNPNIRRTLELFFAVANEIPNALAELQAHIRN